jgi:hypothetical protein
MHNRELIALSFDWSRTVSVTCSDLASLAAGRFNHFAR